MITKHYITMPIGKETMMSIPPSTWELIIDDIINLFELLPDGIELHMKDGIGKPFLESNAIQFSPGKDFGSDFTFKRCDSKKIITVKSKSQIYDDVIGAVLLVIKHHCPELIISNTRGYFGWKKAIVYYQYALQRKAPQIYVQQAGKIIIEFNWSDGMPEEDCDEIMENIQTLLKGNAVNIKVNINN